MSDSAVVVAPATGTGKRGRKPVPAGLKSPSALDFALIYNASSSRRVALANFANAGFHMTYGSLLARVKSYTNPDREGGAIKLKEMPAGQRGRHIDTAGINAAIEAAANAATVVDAAKGGEASAS